MFWYAVLYLQMFWAFFALRWRITGSHKHTVTKISLLLFLWEVMCLATSSVRCWDACYHWSRPSQFLLCCSCIYLPLDRIISWLFFFKNKILKSAHYLMWLLTPSKASVFHCNLMKTLTLQKLMIYLYRCVVAWKNFTFEVFYPTQKWKE